MILSSPLAVCKLFAFSFAFSFTLTPAATFTVASLYQNKSANLNLQKDFSKSNPQNIFIKLNYLNLIPKIFTLTKLTQLLT